VYLRQPVVSSRSTRRLTAGADNPTLSPISRKEVRAFSRSSARIFRSVASTFTA
jgi:hypothetical protein